MFPLPERWGSLVFFGFGGLMWLLRKAVSRPPVVTTTFQAESAVTEPHPAASTYAEDHARLDDDGAPHAPLWDDGDHSRDDRVL